MQELPGISVVALFKTGNHRVTTDCQFYRMPVRCQFRPAPAGGSLVEDVVEAPKGTAGRQGSV